jgi:hypothetical protein
MLILFFITKFLQFLKFLKIFLIFLKSVRLNFYFEIKSVRPKYALNTYTKRIKFLFLSQKI